MIRKILGALGIGAVLMTQANAMDLPAPYKTDEANFIYNLLFCDKPSLFKPKDQSKPTYWEVALFSKPNEKEIRKIAESTEEESRIRVLAYNWLRSNSHAVPKGLLLGVIVEVPLENGLDVLAAYPDGRVRYINQTGKMTIVEGGAPAIESLAKELVAKSKVVVSNIGPWEKARLPAPSRGNIRLTFLVSDGLYFGEGPFSLMQKDPMAAPVINKAVELLQAVVNVSTK